MNSNAIFNAVQSHALTLGIFDRVGTHEPDNAPGNGMTAAIWLAGIRPAPAGSGLASTSGVITLLLRIYKVAAQLPADDIDPEVLTAVDLLFTAYNADFTLGGLIRNVDLFGATGTAMSAVPGYVKVGDTTYRTVDITLPLIINDLWTQAP